VSNYCAYVPDLPGCIATGASVAEVEAEIRDAIVFHLEGLREDGLPVPADARRVAIPAFAGKPSGFLPEASIFELDPTVFRNGRVALALGGKEGRELCAVQAHGLYAGCQQPVTRGWFLNQRGDLHAQALNKRPSSW
jgi:predicted RNase H-like HicB family nuclease